MAGEWFLRDPWAQLGALAGATCTVQIGICVIGPFMRQPAFTAAAAATLDELSGGRVGLGAGGTGFAALWTAAEHPARAVHERVELCWLLWTRRQPFSLEGDLIGFCTDDLHFRPPRTIPVHVAARGPRVLAVADEGTDVVLNSNFVRGRGLECALARAQDEERHRSSPRKTAWIYFSVEDGAEPARLAAARGCALALGSNHALLAEIGYGIPARLAAFLERHRRSLRGEEIAEVAQLVLEDLVSDFTVSVDQASYAATLNRLCGLGIEEIAVLPLVSSARSESEFVERLLTEILQTLAPETVQ